MFDFDFYPYHMDDASLQRSVPYFGVLYHGHLGLMPRPSRETLYWVNRVVLSLMNPLSVGLQHFTCIKCKRPLCWYGVFY